ncbi:MAG: hypothetical protein M3Y86_04940, partial [Verrucomicrobiota bacterium]|nr:hypothetical protein [Verrucomicrobiota bacterium]
DEPYARPRRKASMFLWTIIILLLIGVVFAVWLGSYYIFSQPERPDSYRILQKLHKIEQPKRFQLTAAPAGEFLDPKKLHDRYGALHPAELAKMNAELARNYIRNYQQVRGQVPYVIGRFTILQARELGPNDLFTSGMVALADAVDFGEIMIEHIYPADAQSVPLMKQTLVTGLEIKLERAHDLSAVLHVDRLADGRLLVTIVPLLYGSYTVTQGRGTFSLEPPYELNMAAGWPIFKADQRHEADAAFANYRQHSAAPVPGIIMPGIMPAATPAGGTNALVRVESAQPVAEPSSTVTPSPPLVAAKGGKSGKLAKNEKAAPSPSAVAKSSPAVSATPLSVAANSPLVRPTVAPTATAAPALAVATPIPMPSQAATPLPAPPVNGDMALASTADGGSWKTYPAGKMPAGRLITTSDLRDVAERGLAGERVYLRGQFVVNFAEANRAVLRPKGNMAESVLHLGAPSSTRIIVEFPSGYAPPAQGSTVTRDQARPYEITEVRKQSDGQLNVFVREIMQ